MQPKPAGLSSSLSAFGRSGRQPGFACQSPKVVLNCLLADLVFPGALICLEFVGLGS